MAGTILPGTLPCTAVLSTPHTCGARDSAALRPPEGPPLLTQRLYLYSWSGTTLLLPIGLLLLIGLPINWTASTLLASPCPPAVAMACGHPLRCATRAPLLTQDLNSTHGMDYDPHVPLSSLFFIFIYSTSFFVHLFICSLTDWLVARMLECRRRRHPPCATTTVPLLCQSR